jgi:small subunit ribosomal protein S10
MAQEGGRIRVKLKAWDHRIIDEAAAKIVEAAVTTGARVKGPVPLPTERKLFVVTISPHGNKDAREHYEILNHKRLIDIEQAGVRTMDSLQHLDLPAGVEISIKMK